MVKSNEIKELSPEELLGWIKAEKPFFLIDALIRDHFRRIHLPKARNACVFEVTFIDQVKSMTDDRNSEIVLYGSSRKSLDAVIAAEKLKQNGYKSLHVLRGGIEGWRSADFPVEGEAVDEPSDPQTLLRLDDRSYRVDTARSRIEWTGRNPNTTHFGTINLISGQLEVKNRMINGTCDVDMCSIKNINLEGDKLQSVLIAHLKSDDFFLTDLFPKARFVIEKGKPVDEPFVSVPNYEITGTLELKGRKAQQTFMATVTTTPESALMAEAHFDLDRTQWGIIYGSARFFEHLGMHLVFDSISFQVRIVAN